MSHSRAHDTPEPGTIHGMSALQFSLATLLLEKAGPVDPEAAEPVRINPQDLERGELGLLGWCGCLACWAALIAAANITTLVRMLALRDDCDPMEEWADILRDHARLRAAEGGES